jgi:hypothetical protein
VWSGRVSSGVLALGSSHLHLGLPPTPPHGPSTHGLLGKPYELQGPNAPSAEAKKDRRTEWPQSLEALLSSLWP